MKVLFKRGLMLLLCGLILATAPAQNKQPNYQKKENWVATMLHNRTDLMKNYAGNTFQPFRSKVMRYEDAAQKIELNVTGIRLLYLSVDPTEDGAGMDHAAWANARFIKADGSVVEASAVTVKKQKQGWKELTFDQSLMNKPITIQGKEYSKGMMMHAQGYALFELNGEFVRFEAEIGVEQNGGNNKSSIIFAADDYQMVRYMERVNTDFPIKTNRFREYAGSSAPLIFGAHAEQVMQLVGQKIADEAGIMNLVLPLKGKGLKRQLAQLDELFNLQHQLSEIQAVNGTNVSAAFQHLKELYGDQYLVHVSQEAQVLVPQLENERIRIEKDLKMARPGAREEAQTLLKWARQIVLANPLLHGKDVMLVRQKVGLNKGRSVMGQDLGYPQNNWTTSAAIPNPAAGWNNELAVLKTADGEPAFTTIYQPQQPVVINDPDIHWDGERILFASVNEKKAWHLFEINRDGSGFKQLTPDGYEDIGFFDGCYLPNGKVAMVSTAPYQGVPCIGGVQSTGAIYELNPADKKIRQLNFGQDNDWNPTVLNNGRVMYLRWEYTDATHYFTRILMSMNPDGTGKKEYYGSNSYFPNSMFEARPIPNHPTKFVTIVSGHHGITRSGRLMVFDPAEGRHEADGVVQEIPFKDRKVEPLIKDRLVDGVWPQFLAPYPLDEHFFLVTAKPSPEALWGIYLVDVFDNMTLIAEQEGEALLYPMVLEKKKSPPVIPDKVNLKDSTSTVYIANIYEGQGLKGVAKGSVKALRVFAYHFSYNHTGGHDELGIQSSWDVKRVLGTVPVEADGSAIFKIPANTPVSLQPLDENGRAMQLMRSWLTGMPGEVVSCVGCHESQNTLPPVRPTVASRKMPDDIQPFYGDVRPFAFKNEVQPVLDRKCTPCHNGTNEWPDFSDKKESGYRHLSGAYKALHPYVHRPGPESDLHVLTPMDYHASTSELIQILESGHHGVVLTAEEWDRLHTWIDLNVPYHGRFAPPEYCEHNQKERRQELAHQFNGYKVDLETELKLADYLRQLQDTVPVMPQRPAKKNQKKIQLDRWPMSMAQARARQQELGETSKTIDLGNGLTLELVKIPAGEYVRTNDRGEALGIEKVEKAYWMAQFEVTNAQFARFFPEHDSRFVAQFWKDHTSQGYPINYPELPVARVSWAEAAAFCEQLSAETGMTFALPTESQWEWACRAGSDQALWFGDAQSDFSVYANLADEKLQDFAVIGVDPQPMGQKHHLFKYYNFIPQAPVNDGHMISTRPGSYQSNPWGLYDMHGNVAEWVRDDYSPVTTSSAIDPVIHAGGRKTVKGGSWRDRPHRSTVASQVGYYPWQKVVTVGFRVVMTEE